MDDLRAFGVGGHDQVDRHRLQRGEMRLAAGQCLPRPVGVDIGVGAIGAPAVHREVHARGQLAREVLDVDARAAVDLGRVLAGEQRDAHAQVVAMRAGIRAPLGTTTIPPADTVKPASRSASRSTPTSAPGST